MLDTGGAHRSPVWPEPGADQMLLSEWKGSKPRPLDTAPLASLITGGVEALGSEEEPHGEGVLGGHEVP